MELVTVTQQRKVRDAMREVGAVSPATARPARELPPLVRDQLDWWVNAGVVREGAAGTYYYFEPKPLRAVPKAAVRAILFWLLVVLIPVAIIYLSGGRGPPEP